MAAFTCTGWVELDGRKLAPAEIEKICTTTPNEVKNFGGEFSLSFDTCHARDHFGIMPGPGPKGALVCNDKIITPIDPDPAPCTLEEAIITAVKLRSDEGVVALSGGVDSSLVAALAGRECVAVGLEGSHDLTQAEHAAELLNLSCTIVSHRAGGDRGSPPQGHQSHPEKGPGKHRDRGHPVLHLQVGRGQRLPAHHRRAGGRRTLRRLCPVPVVREPRRRPCPRRCRPRTPGTARPGSSGV